MRNKMGNGISEKLNQDDFFWYAETGETIAEEEGLETKSGKKEIEVSAEVNLENVNQTNAITRSSPKQRASLLASQFEGR